MNGKQERFCREYAMCRCATTAAERAGYRYPESAGLRLLANPEVVARVEDLAVADLDEVRAFLTQALRGEGTLAERMKAADMLLKCGGSTPPRQPVVIFGEEDLV